MGNLAELCAPELEYVQDTDDSIHLSESDGLFANRTRQGLTPIMFAFIAYISVFGAGIYAMESVVKIAYPLLALAGLLVIPWIIGIPAILVSSELAAAIPERAGYVAWVDRAFGPFWSFQEGSLHLFAGIIEVALYPSIFTAYLKQSYPTMSYIAQVSIQLSIIVVAVVLNFFGIKLIGLMSIVTCVMMFVPVLIMTLWGLPFLVPAQWLELPPILDPPQLGLYLGLVSWCISGFDSMGQIASDLQKVKKMRITLILVLAAAIISAFFPMLVSVSRDTAYPHYVEGRYVVIAEFLGKRFMAGFLTVGSGFASLASTYTWIYLYSLMLSNWAERRYLDIPWLCLQTRWGSAWVTLLLLGTCVSIAQFLPFDDLVPVSQNFYLFALLLQFAALIELRYSEPQLPRPYMINLETKGLVLMMLPGVLLAAVTIITGMASSLVAFIITLSYLGFSIAGYFIWSKCKGLR